MYASRKKMRTRKPIINNYENGFCLTYQNPIAHSTKIMSRARPKPRDEHVFFIYEKLSDHYLITKIWSKYQENLAIIDNLPEKDVKKKCLEFCLKEAEEMSQTPILSSLDTSP